MGMVSIAIKLVTWLAVLVVLTSCASSGVPETPHQEEGPGGVSKLNEALQGLEFYLENGVPQLRRKNDG